MHISRPCLRNHTITSAFVTPYARKAPVSQRKPSMWPLCFLLKPMPPKRSVDIVGSCRPVNMSSPGRSSAAITARSACPTLASTGSSSSAQLIASSPYAAFASETKTSSPFGTRHSMSSGVSGFE